MIDPETAEVLQPPGWPQPAGYANGMRARGTFVLTGGMIGWDARQKLADGFVAQVRQALANIVTVLAEGGAQPRHIVRLTWYIVDMEEYRQNLRDVGACYRQVMGRHFPAMALVQVVALVEPDARVEIEATAIVPD